MAEQSLIGLVDILVGQVDETRRQATRVAALEQENVQLRAQVEAFEAEKGSLLAQLDDLTAQVAAMAEQMAQASAAATDPLRHTILTGARVESSHTTVSAPVATEEGSHDGG